VAPEHPRAGPAPAEVTVFICKGAVATALADQRIQDFERRGIELSIICEDPADDGVLLAAGNEDPAALLAAA